MSREIASMKDMERLETSVGWKRVVDYLLMHQETLYKQLAYSVVDGRDDTMSSGKANIIRGRIKEIDDVIKAPSLIKQELKRKERQE